MGAGCLLHVMMLTSTEVRSWNDEKDKVFLLFEDLCLVSISRVPPESSQNR